MSEREDTGTQPVFPPEIEEIIFSLCIQQGLQNTKSLSLVAKRVHEWLKPHLYKVAMLYDNTSHYGRPNFDSQVLKKHGRYVRHILLWEVGSEEAYFLQPSTCLSWCPNIMDIALWHPGTVYDEDLIDRLLGLPLTHISFDITRFHNDLTKHSISKRVSFTSVTHLDLNGMRITLPVEKIKGYFPSLTHMALNKERELSAEAILGCWGDQFEVLIWYTNLDSETGDRLPDDPRFIALPQTWAWINEWHEATKDGPSSIWRRAEEEVRRRRQGLGM
ncbi:hypothetical protein BDN72DRAFT_846543 [Pluteus cervinus]|uniref:Uncharacterized protein n=1 Tax=Pluteus cervinus TaxID=181527 RepID=A0ACD3AFR2_9AGAR|nr:hypothetical protein BDN72DRAFT_846543 [Pluteus cervinus]